MFDQTGQRGLLLLCSAPPALLRKFFPKKPFPLSRCQCATVCTLLLVGLASGSASASALSAMPLIK
jgi:hypothetical protein